MAFHLRPATHKDTSNLVALVNGAYRGDSGRQGWTTEAHLLGGIRIDADRVNALIDAAGSVVLVAEDDGQILGCVHLEKQSASTVYLGMLTVGVQGQAKGLGSRLLKAGEDFARDSWQAARIEMTVITVREELIAWYERRGYRVTGERRPFPSDVRFGIRLAGPLEFDVLEKSIQ